MFYRNCYSLNEYFANIIYDKIDYGIKIIFIFFVTDGILHHEYLTIRRK